MCFSYPDQVDFLPLSAVFDGTDFSARKACDYMGCGETTEVCLVAGRNIEVGKVEIYNDEKYVYVTAHTTGDWYIIETHLKTAATKSGLGQGSNPAPGRFPYKTNHNPAVQKFTYMIPISDAGASFYTAFHASVVKIGQRAGYYKVKLLGLVAKVLLQEVTGQHSLAYILYINATKNRKWIFVGKKRLHGHMVIAITEKGVIGLLLQVITVNTKKQN